jgi:hypothetical protein
MILIFSRPTAGTCGIRIARCRTSDEDLALICRGVLAAVEAVT